MKTAKAQSAPAQNEKTDKKVDYARLIDQAAKSHRYVKLGARPSLLTITNAQKRWADPAHADDVYVRNVVAPPAEVRNHLMQRLSMKAAEADQCIQKEGFSQASLKNSATMERFLAECNAYNDYRQQQSKLASSREFLDHMTDVSKGLDKANVISNRKKRSSNKKEEMLSECLNRLTEEQVIDVSGMVAKASEKTKPWKVTRANKTSGKVSCDGVRIVASTRDAIECALDRLQKEDDKYRGMLENFRASNKTGASQKHDEGKAESKHDEAPKADTSSSPAPPKPKPAATVTKMPPKPATSTSSKKK